VVGFLTPEWLQLAADAAQAVPAPVDLVPGQRLVLAQEVHGTPAGTVRYQLELDAAGVRVSSAPDGGADVTFVCDYTTAAALAQGRTNAQAALMAGALQLRGDVERLSAARDALLALGDVFARVREATEF
jgi:putative sterol carrier protein